MCNRYLMVFAYAYKMVKYSHIRRTEINYLKESSMRKPYNYALVLERWSRCQVLRLGIFRQGKISRYPAEELHSCIPDRFGILFFGLKIADESPQIVNLTTKIMPNLSKIAISLFLKSFLSIIRA